MPRLIHLNGPPRVGKSTLARRWADDHPGTLALDLDVIAGMVGGWREDFSSALNLTRPDGLALATAHLRLGHDVVVPQLVTAHDQGLRFEDAARAAGAAYVDVVLLVDTDEHRARVRGKQPGHAVEARIQELLDDPEDDLLERIDGHLATYLDGRPEAVRIDTTGQTVDATYAALTQVLARQA